MKPKCWYLHTKLHNVVSQYTVIEILAAKILKIWNYLPSLGVVILACLESKFRECVCFWHAVYPLGKGSAHHNIPTVAKQYIRMYRLEERCSWSEWTTDLSVHWIRSWLCESGWGKTDNPCLCCQSKPVRILCRQSFSDCVKLVSLSGLKLV